MQKRCCNLQIIVADAVKTHHACRASLVRLFSALTLSGESSIELQPILFVLCSLAVLAGAAWIFKHLCRTPGWGSAAFGLDVLEHGLATHLPHVKLHSLANDRLAHCCSSQTSEQKPNANYILVYTRS